MARTFAGWEDAVNRELDRMNMSSVLDWADLDTRQMFEMGVSPRHAAHDIVSGHDYR